MLRLAGLCDTLTASEDPIVRRAESHLLDSKSRNENRPKKGHDPPDLNDLASEEKGVVDPSRARQVKECNSAAAVATASEMNG